MSTINWNKLGIPQKIASNVLEGLKNKDKVNKKV